MKIAQVSPVFGTTGGPEVVVQNLTNELVALGEDVTLFAPADWKTSAKHVKTLPKSLWNLKNFKETSNNTRINLIISHLIKALLEAKKFDIIHFHIQKYSFAFADNSPVPAVISFHNNIEKDIFNYFSKNKNIYTVALSNSQGMNLKTSAVIYNGVPTQKIIFSKKSGNYLIAIGRLSDQKGIHLAISAAKKAKMKLIIMGRVGISKEKQEYFNKKIKPFIDNKNIVHIFEVPHDKIYSYLRNAAALIFPIQAPEVCSMTVLESLASGTPVIATKLDPMPELIENGKTGFLVNTEDEMVEKIRQIKDLNRDDCRKAAVEKFDSRIMAQNYIKLYEKILKDKNEH